MNLHLFKKFVRVFIALILLLTGLVKLFPIELFESFILSKGLISWELTPIVARLLIGGEVLVGLLLLIGFRLKQVTIPIALAMLSVYTVYLCLDLVLNGNQDDCGCFGTWLQFSTLEGVIKNIILILLTFWVGRDKTSQSKFINSWNIFCLCTLIAMVSPFVIRFLPPLPKAPAEVSEAVDYKPLFKGINVAEPFETHEKFLVAFLSLDCEHCKAAIKKLKLIDAQNNLVPIHCFLWGKEELLATFIEETELEFDYTLVKDPIFFNYNGGGVPTVHLVKNDTIKKWWRGDLYDDDDFVNYASED